MIARIGPFSNRVSAGRDCQAEVRALRRGLIDETGDSEPVEYGRLPGKTACCLSVHSIPCDQYGLHRVSVSPLVGCSIAPTGGPVQYDFVDHIPLGTQNAHYNSRLVEHSTSPFGTPLPERSQQLKSRQTSPSYECVDTVQTRHVPRIVGSPTHLEYARVADRENWGMSRGRSEGWEVK